MVDVMRSQVWTINHVLLSEAGPSREHHHPLKKARSFFSSSFFNRKCRSVSVVFWFFVRRNIQPKPYRTEHFLVGFSTKPVKWSTFPRVPCAYVYVGTVSIRWRPPSPLLVRIPSFWHFFQPPTPTVWEFSGIFLGMKNLMRNSSSVDYQQCCRSRAKS